MRPDNIVLTQLKQRCDALDLWLGQPNEFERLIDGPGSRPFSFHVGLVTRERTVRRHPAQWGFRSLAEVKAFVEVVEANQAAEDSRVVRLAAARRERGLQPLQPRPVGGDG